MTTDLAFLAANPARLAEVAHDQLPELVGEAAALHARILARLLAPGTTTPAVEPAQVDRGLDVHEAAERTGMSERWLYRHSGELPFARKIGGALRFDARGLERWLAARKKVDR